MGTIISADKKCFWPHCDRTDIQMHHLWAGSYRKAADRFGLVIPLCYDHHMQLHENESDMKIMRAFAQGYAMGHYGWTLEEFISYIGRSFL
jgi:hypothetical protein